MENLTRFQKGAFLIAGLALVAGLSFLFALSGRQEPVLDRVPEDVVERGRAGAPELPDGGPSRSGGILVSPSETVIGGINAGFTLPPISVTNKSLQPQAIEVDFIPVERFLVDGLPVVEKTEQKEEEGEGLVILSKKSFNLNPGDSTTVTPRIIAKPDSGTIVGSIGFIVLDKNPTFSNPEKNDVRYQIENNLRINSMLYATFAGNTGQDVSVKQLRGFQDQEDGKKIDFSVRVQGKKGISSPTGTLTIENSLGQVVEKRRIEPNQRVVAGSERDIGIDKPIAGLKSGSYEAVATIISGNNKQTVRWTFQIDRNGTLPTPQTEVFLEARPNYLKKKEGFNVFLQVENSGTKPIGPEGYLRLYKLGQEKIIKEVPIKLPPMNPGDIETLEEPFIAPGESGNYEVLLTLEAEDRSLLDQRVASILVAKDPPEKPGPFIKFRDWLSDEPFAALGLGMLIFGIILGSLTGIIVWHGRRR